MTTFTLNRQVCETFPNCNIIHNLGHSQTAWRIFFCFLTNLLFSKFPMHVFYTTIAINLLTDNIGVKYIIKSTFSWLEFSKGTFVSVIIFPPTNAQFYNVVVTHPQPNIILWMSFWLLWSHPYIKCLN